MSKNRRTGGPAASGKGATGKGPKQRWSAAKRAQVRKAGSKPPTPREERRAAMRADEGTEAVRRGRRADARRDREWEGRDRNSGEWRDRRYKDSDGDQRRGGVHQERGYRRGGDERDDRRDGDHNRGTAGRPRSDRGDRDGWDNRSDRRAGDRRDYHGARDERGGYRGRDEGSLHRRDDQVRRGAGPRRDDDRRYDDRRGAGHARRDDRRYDDRRGAGHASRDDRRYDDRRGSRERDNRDGRGRGSREDGARRAEGGYDRRSDRRQERYQDGGYRRGEGASRHSDARDHTDRRDARRSEGPRPDSHRSGGEPHARHERRDDRGHRDFGERYERRDRADARRDTTRAGDTHSQYEAERLRRTERPRRVEIPDDPGSGFRGLGVPMPIVERLARDGIAEPFPIQKATIPDAIAGRDVLGRGRTGSGKTMAFGIPVLTRLAGRRSEPRHPRALILSPTRELAMQIADALGPLARAMDLRHKLVAGGMPYEPQITALERGVDVLVATPGRINDLVERGAAVLDEVETFVLDEADLMADMGFLPEVTALLDLVPEGGQRLLFSATLDKGVDELVETYLHDPVEHSTDDAKASVATMTHHIFLVEPKYKKPITGDIANRPGRTVVFVRTKLGADRVAEQLREQGVFAAALHGGLNQGMRNRILAAFKDGTLPVLVATDVASRGIHVDDVSAVLQVDPPKDHKDYLHRAGRTARAGSEGVVVTLALPHQRKQMKRIATDAGLAVEPQRVDLGDDEIIAATGASRPSGVQVPEERLRAITDPPRRPRPRPRGQGGRGGHGGRSGGHGQGYSRGRREGGYRGDNRSADR